MDKYFLIVQATKPARCDLKEFDTLDDCLREYEAAKNKADESFGDKVVAIYGRRIA